MTLPLYTVEKETRGRIYCGPFCVMAITGLEYEKVRASINYLRRRQINQPVFGTYGRELRETFRSFGWGMWTAEEWGRREGPTLAKWIRDRRTILNRDTYFLISLTNHWCVITGTRFMDTYTKAPTSLRDAPHRRARVHRVYTVSKL